MTAELIDASTHGADRIYSTLRQRHGLVVDGPVIAPGGDGVAADASMLAAGCGEMYSDFVFLGGRSRLSAVSSGRLVVSCMVSGSAEITGLSSERTVLGVGDVIAWPIGHAVEVRGCELEQHTISLPLRSLRMAGYRGDRVTPRLLARPVSPTLTDLWWRNAQFVDQELNREDFFADPRVVGALEQLLAAVALRVFSPVEPGRPFRGLSR